MPFVLDCSVTMAWVFRDEATDGTDRLRDMLGENRALVPALWPTETANALLAATRRKRIEREEWPRLRMQLDALPIDVDPVSPARAWGPRSISRRSMTLRSTTRRTSNSPCEVVFRSPRWIALSAPPRGRRGAGCRRSSEQGKKHGCRVVVDGDSLAPARYAGSFR